MRFECDSCQAKYKISDDKVRGRVVRFPCRKCDHKILIDGRQNDADVTVPAGSAYGFDEVTRRSEPHSPFSAHEAATARARRPSSRARRRPSSVPPRRASASSRRVSSVAVAATTSSVTAGQHPGLTPPLPAAVAAPQVGTSSDVPEWHVSINDVPIGPIRLEEMAHKIDAGAVSEYSLVWRTGFDEWRPLGAVPALVSLLHERRHSGPPPRSSFSSMPPLAEMSSKPSRPISVPVAAAQLASPPSSFPHGTPMGDDDEIAPLADALQPEEGIGDPFGPVSQPPAPIGPEEVFGSSPQLGAFSGLPPSTEEPVSVPSSPPAPAAATQEPRRRVSIGVWVLVIAVAVFSGVVAFLAFDRFGGELLDQWIGALEPEKAPVRAERAPSARAPVEAPESASADDAQAEPTADDSMQTSDDTGDADTMQPEQDGSTDAEAAGQEQGADPKDAKLVAPPDPSDNRPVIKPAPRPRPRRARRPPPKAETPAAAAAVEAESDLSAAEQKILDEFGSAGDSAPAKIDVQDAPGKKNDNPPLDGDAVRSTVSANKSKLQRCYERAIRGQQSPPSVRLDVTVRVAASGRVKDVSSEGDGPGGLAACVEASVRRWRFPASAEGGPARFPIVFSSN